MSGLADAWIEVAWDASVASAVGAAAAFALTRAWRGMPPAAACWLWRLVCAHALLCFVAPEVFELAWLPADPVASVSVTAFASDSSLTTGAAPAAPTSSGTGWVVFAFWLWCAGVIAGTVRLAAQFVYTRRVRRGACLVAHVSGVPVYEAAVASPALLGVFDPIVTVPPGLLAAAGAGELVAIVEHEVAHRERSDLIWGWIPALAGTVLFFHPLVWLARREHRIAQEIATDARALASGRVSVGCYARTLLALSDVPLADSAPRVGAAGHLQRRLSSIAWAPRPSGLARAAAVALLAVGGALTIPWHFTTRDRDDDVVVASPDGALTVDVGALALTVSDAASGRIRWRAELPTQVSAVAFSADGRVLAAGSRDRAVRVWSAAGGEPIATLSGHAGAITSVAVSPDGSRVACAYRNRATVWALESGSPTHLAPIPEAIERLSFVGGTEFLVADTHSGARYQLAVLRTLLAGMPAD